uniref:mannose-1-phosphate guanylyltransferase n=1 Tax=Ornithobacterium rhinotracheale TaxID=28251 RepID=UPI0039A781A2
METLDKKNIYCVIMAGGVGSRFWPMSTTSNPKQFHDVLGTGKTLIQQTFDRLLNFCLPENIYVITDQKYTDLVQEQLPKISPENIVAEPVGMNTAPCAIYTAYKIYKCNPEAEILVCPSDHLILNEQKFTEIALTALENSAKNHGLYTLGIQPTRPDTGYGYIQFDAADEGEVKKVKTFTEKPNLELAQQFLQSGDFLWNSGIFIWSAKDILNSFENHMPEMSQAFQAVENVLNTNKEVEEIKRVYPTLQQVSVDVAIMEKEQNVYVIPSEFGWSDLGTWLSLYENTEKDENGNAFSSKNVFTYNAKDNIIFAPQEKLVVVDGLEDYIVVDTPQALLISPIENSQEIKSYVRDLKLNKKEKFV